ncbi:MAG: branched-chain amino acid ABC transporter ATP-binding protein/permease [Chthonomonadaceae bacterium]|nr:branched-chain amino acid ABC transporter ATP-binding protein/permease [Chthonomonadaceae bacterium]
MPRSAPFLTKWLLIVGSVFGLWALNRFLNSTTSAGVPILHPTFLRILYLCAISVTLAVSLNLVNGFTGQFSIGHAGFMAVGAYAGAAVTHVFPALQNQFGLLIATLFGAFVAGMFGYGVGVPSLRLKGDYLAIVTLGFGEIIRVFLANTDKIPGLNFMGGSLGMSNIPALTNFFWTIGLAVLVIVVSRNLKRSLHGLAFLSVREDEIAANAMGVNTTKIKVTAFVLSAAFAGAAGSLFAHSESYLDPKYFNFTFSINIVVMVVLGGLGSITGTTITAIFFTALPELLRNANTGVIKEYYKDDYRLVAFALLLALTMLLRPQGLMGKREWTLFKKRAEDLPSVGFGEGNDSLSSNLTPQSSTLPPVLKCLDVMKRFGGLVAVDGFHVLLKPGELVGMIGPNGAGKTTAFNLLTGVYEPTSGAVIFDGTQISGDNPYPPQTRSLLLAKDALITALGAYLVGTVIYSCVSSLNVPPAELYKVFGMALKSGIVWTVIIGSVAYSLFTAKTRRINQPGMPSYQCSNQGISRTFQNIRLFQELTVLENILVGSAGKLKTNLFSAIFGTQAMFREEQIARAKARRILKQFGMERLENEQARNLPYGDQRRLEIARALMTGPKLLLLDEPAAGMNPQEKVQLMSLIRQIRDDFNLTILLIEHDMRLVMGICERIYVLEYGRIISEGTPEQVRNDPKVVAAYLGVEVEDEQNEMSVNPGIGGAVDA